MTINSVGNSGAEYLRTSLNKQQEPAAEAAKTDAAAAVQATDIPQAAQVSEGSSSSLSQEQQEMEMKQKAAAIQQASATTTSATEDEDDDDSNYESIVQKVNSGQTLSASELSVLAEKNPSLYNKAIQASRARSELRQQMETNPSAAGRIAGEAITNLRAQAAQNGGGDSAAVANALENEYNGFAKKYDQVLF